MAAVMFTVGKQRVAINASVVGGGAAVGLAQTVSRYVMTMSVDDGTVNFAAADTAANTGGAITNFYDQLLDALATRAGQVVTHIMTITGVTYDGLTVKRILLHDDTVANVSASSNTIICGFDQLSNLKTAGINFQTTVTLTYS